MQSWTRATTTTTTTFELTGEEKQDEGEHQRVTEIEKRRRAIGDFEFSEKVVDRVQEEVHGGEARGEKGTPPPVVILNDRR